METNGNQNLSNIQSFTVPSMCPVCGCMNISYFIQYSFSLSSQPSTMPIANLHVKRDSLHVRLLFMRLCCTNPLQDENTLFPMSKLCVKRIMPAGGTAVSCLNYPLPVLTLFALWTWSIKQRVTCFQVVQYMFHLQPLFLKTLSASVICILLFSESVLRFKILLI